MCIRRTLQFTRSVPVLPQSLPITPEDRAGTISPILQMITVVLGWWSWEENPGLRTPSPVEVPFAMEYSQVVESSISEPGVGVGGGGTQVACSPSPSPNFSCFPSGQRKTLERRWNSTSFSEGRKLRIPVLLDLRETAVALRFGVLL